MADDEKSKRYEKRRGVRNAIQDLLYGGTRPRDPSGSETTRDMIEQVTKTLKQTTADNHPTVAADADLVRSARDAIHNLIKTTDASKATDTIQDEDSKELSKLLSGFEKYGIKLKNSEDVDDYTHDVDYQEFSRQTIKVHEVNFIFSHLPLVKRIVKKLTSDICNEHTTFLTNRKHVHIPESFNIGEQERSLLIKECEKVYNRYNIGEFYRDIIFKVLAYGYAGVITLPIGEVFKTMTKVAKYQNKKLGELTTKVEGRITGLSSVTEASSVSIENYFEVNRNKELHTYQSGIEEALKEVSSIDTLEYLNSLSGAPEPTNNWAPIDSALESFSNMHNFDKINIESIANNHKQSLNQYFSIGEKIYNNLNTDTKGMIQQLVVEHAIETASKDDNWIANFKKTLKKDPGLKTYKQYCNTYESLFVTKISTDAKRSVDDSVRVVNDNEVSKQLLCKSEIVKTIQAYEGNNIDGPDKESNDTLLIKISGEAILPIHRNGVTVGYYVLLRDDTLDNGPKKSQDNNPHGWNGDPQQRGMSAQYGGSVIGGQGGTGVMNGVPGMPMSPYSAYGMGAGIGGGVGPAGSNMAMMGTTSMGMYGYGQMQSLHGYGMGTGSAMMTQHGNNLMGAGGRHPLSDQGNIDSKYDVVFNKMFHDILNRKLKDENDKDGETLGLTEAERNAVAAATIEMLKSGKGGIDVLYMTTDAIQYVTLDTYSSGIGKGILDDVLYLCGMAILNSVAELHSRISKVVRVEKVGIPLRAQDIPGAAAFMDQVELALSKWTPPYTMLSSGMPLHQVVQQVFKPQGRIIPDIDGEPLYTLDTMDPLANGGIEADDEFTQKLMEQIAMGANAPTHALNMYKQSDEFATSIMTKDIEYRDDIHGFRKMIEDKLGTPIFRRIIKNLNIGRTNIFRKDELDDDEPNNTYLPDEAYNKMDLHDRSKYVKISDMISYQLPREFKMECEMLADTISAMKTLIDNVGDAIVPETGSAADVKRNAMKSKIIRKMMTDSGMGEIVEIHDSVGSIDVMITTLINTVGRDKLQENIESIASKLKPDDDGGGGF